MKTYILKRLLLMIPTLLGITVITFVIIQFAPGDPAALRVGSSLQGVIGEEQLAREIIEKTRAQFGLDKPIHVQYLLWVQRIVTLDFGRSYKDNRPGDGKDPGEVADHFAVEHYLHLSGLSVCHPHRNLFLHPSAFFLG